MELTKSQKEAFNKQLVERYGDINGWKIDHWKHFDVLLDLMVKEWSYNYNLNNDDLIKDNLNTDFYVEKYDKEAQGLVLEASELHALTKAMEHVEGLEVTNKLTIVNNLRDGSANLMLQARALLDKAQNLLQDKADNPPTFIPQKPVGRPSSNFRYQWMDYLASELGSNKKAADYASDFPPLGSIKPASLLREYRKYRKARGEG
jgi:hypothetical protein